jgi:8-oxo-dGTP pyrophosphatase MutT (NUDIX family)
VTTSLPISEWQLRLRAAVSPLGDGVGQLKVMGHGPLGGNGMRPDRTAAVLVPVLDEEQPLVVLTRRADDLPHHAGQVSFPGGRAEPQDASAVHTALREAHEEIGLPHTHVTPLGFLDRFDIISDYRVLPVVGLVRTPVRWMLDQREVAEILTVPLEIAINRDHYQRREYRSGDLRYVGYSMDWQGHTIWGATAAMLLNLGDRLSHCGEIGVA